MKPSAYKLIEPEDAVVEPVTLDEAKLHLKVDHADDDAYITDLIIAAREFCEEHTARSFTPQSWQLGYPGWPCANLWERWTFRPELDLYHPPVFSIMSVKYRAAGDDDLADLDASLYKFDPDVLPGVIRLKKSTALPSLNLDYSTPVQVVVSCGLSAEDTPAMVPVRVKLAIKQMLTQFYENRVPVIAGTIASSVPLTALDLLARLKIRKA